VNTTTPAELQNEEDFEFNKSVVTPLRQALLEASEYL